MTEFLFDSIGPDARPCPGHDRSVSHNRLSDSTKKRLRFPTGCWAARLQFEIGCLVLLALLLGGHSILADGTVVQTIQLRPGWNAIHLEVDPLERATGATFQNAPIEGVWTYGIRLPAVDFIQDPNEPIWNRNQWLVYLPTNRVESFQNNLFQLQANRSYLIKATVNHTLSVEGYPVLPQSDWVPDAYNLRGLPVDPVSPPTFLEFFRHSNAHYVTNQLQKIYRLGASGQWSLVAPSERPQRGEAYWIYTRGGSDYLGPFEVLIGGAGALDFGRSVEQTTVGLKNRSTSTRNVQLRDRNPTPPSLVSYYRFDPVAGGSWTALPAVQVTAAPAGADTSVRLAVRRQDFATNTHRTVLEFSDGLGTFYRVAASASRSTETAVNQRAGLWLGTISVNSVAEAHSINPTVTTPTKSQFNLRLLLHVDRTGNTRLLKDVIQMWKDGTYTNDASGNQWVAQPGRFVLVTDERLIPQFQGAASQGGVPVGRRLSTAGFDFAPGADGNALLLSGAFGGSGTLQGTINLPANFPTNPYRHKYHPDHNNFDATYQLYREEAYPFTRSFALQFSPTNTTSVPTPGYGADLWGGQYSETVTGLHKQPIVATGSFVLRRVAVTDVLNQ